MVSGHLGQGLALGRPEANREMGWGQTVRLTIDQRALRQPVSTWLRVLFSGSESLWRSRCEVEVRVRKVFVRPDVFSGRIFVS